MFSVAAWRIILGCLTLAIGVSCNNAANTASKPAGVYEIGDPEFARKIALVRNAYDNGSWENYTSFFADSVTFRFADGTQWNISADTLQSRLQYYRGFLTSNSNIAETEMVITDKSTGDTWVRSWGREKWTDKEGKADSIMLQENWKFNRNGKITTLLVYTSKY